MTKKTKILRFTAEWCGPCKLLAPIFDKVTKTHFPDFEAVVVDIDKDMNLAIGYGIRSVPTVMIVQEGGNVLGTVIGAVSETELTDFITKHLPDGW